MYHVSGSRCLSPTPPHHRRSYLNCVRFPLMCFDVLCHRHWIASSCHLTPRRGKFAPFHCSSFYVVSIVPIHVTGSSWLIPTPSSSSLLSKLSEVSPLPSSDVLCRLRCIASSCHLTPPRVKFPPSPGAHFTHILCG